MIGEGEIPERVLQCLKEFFLGLGRDVPVLDNDTDLLAGTGASSDEGVDFAIELEDALGVPVPNDFNPFVHVSGRRGMLCQELISHARQFIQNAKEVNRVEN